MQPKYDHLVQVIESDGSFEHSIFGHDDTSDQYRTAIQDLCSNSYTGDNDMGLASDDEETITDGKPTKEAVLKKILDNAIADFGLSARDVYKGIFEGYRHEMTMELNAWSYDSLVGALEKCLKQDAPSNELSHTLFSIDTPTALGYAHEIRVDFKSNWIKKQIEKRLDSLDWFNLRKRLHDIAFSPAAGSVQGKLYEYFAIRVLSEGKSDANNWLKSMERKRKDGSETYTVATLQGRAHPFNRVRERQAVEFRTMKSLDEQLNSLDNFFWIPETSNNPFFDAFAIDFEDRTGTILPIIWVIQATISPRHAGSAKGGDLITRIKSKVKKAADMKRQEGHVVDGVVEVNLVLVSDKESDWTLPDMPKWFLSEPHGVYYMCIAVCDRLQLSWISCTTDDHFSLMKRNDREWAADRGAQPNVVYR